jgi:FkbM family methyltransferase
MPHPLLRFAAFTARLMPVRLRMAFYRLGPLTRAIRASLNRAAPQGPSQVQIAAGALQGAQFILDMQLDKDFWLGTYEAELQAAIREFIQPGMVVYDVGANIGYVSLMLARSVGERGRVLAFEALPDNVARLRQNLSLNPEGRWITPIHAAVVGAPGPARFLVGSTALVGKAEGSAGRRWEYESAISVPGLSLDDFVFGQGHPAPQAVKMDIEGGEVLALPGMRQVLRQARPWMLLELHGPESARAAWDELTAAGYRLQRMQPGWPEIASLEELDWKVYVVAGPGPD